MRWWTGLTRRVGLSARCQGVWCTRTTCCTGVQGSWSGINRYVSMGSVLSSVMFSAFALLAPSVPRLATAGNTLWCAVHPLQMSGFFLCRPIHSSWDLRAMQCEGESCRLLSDEVLELDSHNTMRLENTAPVRSIFALEMTLIT